MTESADLPIQKPVSIWHRPIKVKFGDLAKALGESAIAGAFGNWEGISSSGLSALEAVGLGSHEAGAIAWLLVQRSLLQAMSDLLKDYRSELVQEPNFKQLCEELDSVLTDSNSSLTPNFFHHPKQLSIVASCQKPYQNWLQECGLPQHDADAIAKRLPSYFVYALNDQWRRNPQDYVILQESLSTPFTTANERELAWVRYSAWLQRRIDEPMFAEAFSLRQIYVPLCAYYERKKNNPDNEQLLHLSQSGKDHAERVVVNLEAILDNWLKASDKNDAVRVICGGPGCGKSSFAKMFADHLIKNQTIPVILVPLHQFDLSGDLIDAMQDFVQADLDSILPPNPLDRDHAEKQILIIFDGLDELVMQGKSATQAVQDFVREILRKLIAFNRNEARVMVLMSGREVVVQNNRSEFRKEGQILYVMPYCQTKAERENYTYVDPNGLLENDLRKQWWQTYGALKSKGYTDIPAELDRENLAEVTAQPLLNYLVALSYDRGELDFSEDSNLNMIYADLLKRVYERDWAEYQHPTLGNISLEDFVRILEEIAIACWHGDGRTTTVEKIKSRCVSGKLKQILEIFQGGAQEGVTRLLTAFYFRQSGIHGGDATFEFTHKSFGEYLIARRIVFELRLIQQQLSLHRENPDIGWDEKECLRRWAILCGPTYLGWYLLKFLRDEIKLQPLKELEIWQLTLCDLISYMFKNGMPMEQIDTAPRYLDKLLQALHSEEVLLAALSSCALVTQKISNIQIDNERLFGIWLGRIMGQRYNDMSDKVVTACLNHLNLQGYSLHYRDLAGANLHKSNLSGVNLSNSVLIEADLSETDLSGANLNEANILGASLKKANLNGASLEAANCLGANFEEADLSSTNLTITVLNGATFTNTDFSGAYFHETDLCIDDLSDTNLLGARFCEVKHKSERGRKLSKTQISELKERGVIFEPGIFIV